MIFSNGFPRPTGATDYLDSPVCAAMLIIAGYSDFTMPVYFENGQPVRFPGTDPSTFSRDQLLPMVAGYKLQGKYSSYRTTCPNGDWLSPSHRNHLAICAGRSPSWLGLQWLKADILWHSKYKGGLTEPNQLIAMLIIAGPEYVKLWCKWNPFWMGSILTYWSNWRKEPELGEKLISTIDGIIK